MIATGLPLADRRLHALTVVVIAVAVARSACAFVGDGDPDPNFGTSGPGYTIIDFGNGTNAHQDGAHRLLRQPDGKFVAVGSVDTGNGHQTIGMARIDNDGSVDSSFGYLGRSIPFFGDPGFDIFGNGIARMADGTFAIAATLNQASISGALYTFSSDGNQEEWAAHGPPQSAYNDVLTLADGNLLIGGSLRSASSNDFSLVLYDSLGGLIDDLTVAFDRGGSNDDQAQHISFMPAAAGGRLGYVYAIGAVAMPDYASGHHDIECGIVKVGLYSTAPRLRLEPTFGSGGKVLLDINAAWLPNAGGEAIDGNAYCRGLSVRKDGALMISGERYYFGLYNDHPTADDSMGFAAKLDANGVADATFGNSAPGISFFYDGIAIASGSYVGFWFALSQGNGLPLFGGLTAQSCYSGQPRRDRSWVLRASADGSQDATYTDFFCNAPRPADDEGFDVALDGVFDAGNVVTVGNVFSSINPGSATDFVFMRHHSDRIFTDNFDPGY